MSLINASDCSSKQMYHLMTQLIIPRPIAWVLTQNTNQTLNLAPFSYFNGISSDPPLLMLSVGKKTDGQKKDTWMNIDNSGQFVVHIASTDLIKPVSETSEALDYGQSEIEKNNIRTTPVENWPLPRIESAKAAFLCTKYKIIEIGSKPQALILGEIKSIWLDDAILEIKDEHFLVDAASLNPLSRLGKDQYGSIKIIE